MIRLSSAGTRAVPGMSLAAVVASSPLGRGADPSGKVFRRLTAEMVEGSDLVPGAAAGWAALVRSAAARCGAVRAHAGGDDDVDDPLGAHP